MAKVSQSFTVQPGDCVNVCQHFRKRTIVLSIGIANAEAFSVESVVGEKETTFVLKEPLPAVHIDTYPAVCGPDIEVTVRNVTNKVANLVVTFFYQYLDEVPLQCVQVDRYVIFRAEKIEPLAVRYIVVNVPEFFSATKVHVEGDSARCFKIIDLQVGSVSQLTMRDTLIAGALNDQDVRFDTSQVMQDLRLIVMNVGSMPLDFELALDGIVATYVE